MTTHDTDHLAPLVKRVVVPTTPQRAFVTFTTGIADWWPLATHSVARERARQVVFEPAAGSWPSASTEMGADALGVGSRIIEYDDGGPVGAWGTVTTWDPPRLVAFSWHPGRDPAEATRVSVRFTAVESGTEVELIHDDWPHRADGARARRDYDGGWDHVLGRFVSARWPG